MTWNANLSTAPQDAPVWLASQCGKVIKSQWSKTKTGGYWPGFKSDGSTAPIAWQEYVVPAHPNLRESASEQPEAHGSSPCIGSREDHRPATYGQLVTAGETATNSTTVQPMAVSTGEIEFMSACDCEGSV